jgi:thioredoxin reductase
VQAVKAAVSVPVVAVGVIRSAEQAERLLADGVQDFIGLGRPLLADPEWANKALRGDDQSIRRCISCLHCMHEYERGMSSGQPVSCAVNARACREQEFAPTGRTDGDGRRVVIVGAGPAGLTAAIELVKRRFEVVVLEKERVLGGQLQIGKNPPHKGKIAWCIEDLEREAKARAVEIRYGVLASRDVVTALRPHTVLVAAGASPIVPNIPGVRDDYVTTVPHVLAGEVRYAGKSIAVIGAGMTGLETAELLASQGNAVVVIDSAARVAPGSHRTNVWDVKRRLDAMDVTYRLGRRLLAIADHRLTLVGRDGVQESLYADAVVLSLGLRSNRHVVEALRGTCDRVLAIGDVVAPGDIASAVRTGFEAARHLE